MSEPSLTERLTRLEAHLAFAVETWGLERSHVEGMRHMLGQVTECKPTAERLERLEGLIEAAGLVEGEVVSQPLKLRGRT